METILPLASFFRIFSILLVTLIGQVIVRGLSRQLVGKISTGVLNQRRLRSMSSIFITTLTALIWITAVLMILKEVGFDITPLLASAGLIGLAISFGAQAIIRDMISGFFILMEDQFDEGDEVEIQGKKGIVDKVSLRTVILKDDKGTAHYIPNGSITVVSNFSKKK